MATSVVLHLLAVTSLGASGVLACGTRKTSNSPTKRTCQPENKLLDPDHPFQSLSIKLPNGEFYVNAKVHFKEPKHETLLTLLHGHSPGMERSEGDSRGENSSPCYPRGKWLKLSLGYGSPKWTVGTKTFERNSSIIIQLDEVYSSAISIPEWRNRTMDFVQIVKSDEVDLKCEHKESTPTAWSGCNTTNTIKEQDPNSSSPTNDSQMIPFCSATIVLTVLLLLSISTNAFFAYQKHRESCHALINKISHPATRPNNNNVSDGGLNTTETREEEQYADTENSIYFELKEENSGTPEGTRPEDLYFIQNDNYKLTPNLQRNQKHDISGVGGDHHNHHHNFRIETCHMKPQPGGGMTSKNLPVPSY